MYAAPRAVLINAPPVQVQHPGVRLIYVRYMVRDVRPAPPRQSHHDRIAGVLAPACAGRRASCHPPPPSENHRSHDQDKQQHHAGPPDPAPKEGVQECSARKPMFAVSTSAGPNDFANCGAERGQSHHDGNLLVSPARVLSLARLRSSRQHGLFACHGAGDSCVLVDMQSALHGAESIGALRTFAVATCAGTGLTIPECHCRVCTQALYRAHRGPRPVSSLPMDSALVVPSTPTRAPLCSRRGRARSATQSASAPNRVRG
jgi:hypothetical protein